MAKKQKYFAKKVMVDGIDFASKKESERYLYLKQCERRGEIQNLQLQVPFEILPPQYEDVEEYTPKTHKKKIAHKLVERSIRYVADFVYCQDGKIIVEDVKGYRMAGAYTVFVIKRKLMLYFYGIRIHEV